MDVEQAKIIRKMVAEAVAEKRKSRVPPALFYIAGFLSILFSSVVLVLKIIGFLAWPWWLVSTAPLWSLAASFIGTIGFFYLFAGLLAVVFGFGSWILSFWRKK